MNDSFEVFAAVVETGSFSLAAKRLHKSPSAISKHIAGLESRYNAHFFDRTTRSLKLTEAGNVYYAHSKEMYQRERNVKKELESLTGNPAGEIRLTWPSGMAFSALVPAMGAFSNVYPDIRFDVVATNDIINLKEEGVDIAFRTAPKETADLVGIELFRVQPLFCASPEFIERYGPLEQLSDLSRVPTILPSFMNLMQKARGRFPEMAQIKVDEQHHASDTVGICNMCCAGLGAAFLFEHIIKHELERGELVRLFPQLPIAPLPVHLVHHKERYMPQRLRVFIDFLKRYFLYPDEATDLNA